jgi:hypothetical protein
MCFGRDFDLSKLGFDGSYRDREGHVCKMWEMTCIKVFNRLRLIEVHSNWSINQKMGHASRWEILYVKSDWQTSIDWSTLDQSDWDKSQWPCEKQHALSGANTFPLIEVGHNPSKSILGIQRKTFKIYKWGEKKIVRRLKMGIENNRREWDLTWF